MAWEPDRRSNYFFFSPPAHLCAVAYMTEISLIVTLNSQFNSTITLGIRRTHSRLNPPGPHGGFNFFRLIKSLIEIWREIGNKIMLTWKSVSCKSLFLSSVTLKSPCSANLKNLSEVLNDDFKKRILSDIGVCLDNSFTVSRSGQGQEGHDTCKINITIQNHFR